MTIRRVIHYASAVVPAPTLPWGGLAHSCCAPGGIVLPPGVCQWWYAASLPDPLAVAGMPSRACLPSARPGCVVCHTGCASGALFCHSSSVPAALHLPGVTRLYLDGHSTRRDVVPQPAFTALPGAYVTLIILPRATFPLPARELARGMGVDSAPATRRQWASPFALPCGKHMHTTQRAHGFGQIMHTGYCWLRGLHCAPPHTVLLPCGVEGSRNGPTRTARATSTSCDSGRYVLPEA